MQTVAESNLECLVQQCIEKSVEMEDTAASVGIACKVLLDSEQRWGSVRNRQFVS